MARSRRSFSAEFKSQLVLELLTGSVSQAELCRKHNVNPQLIAHWKAIFLDRLPTLFGAEEQHDQQHIRVAELEQLVGRQAYELEVLKKASRLLTGPASKSVKSS